MKQSTAIGGAIVGASIVGLWSITRFDFGLHAVLTAIGVALFVAGIIGGMMVIFADERRA